MSRERGGAWFLIRTPRDLDDAIDAYTSLRVALIAEIQHAREHADDIPPEYRDAGAARVAEARAQLERVDGVLAMLQSRRRSTSRRTTT